MRKMFSFDKKSENNLNLVVEKGRFSSSAEAVRESILINKTLHDLAEAGFTELVVRNPTNGKERTIIVPSLGYRV